MAAQIRAFQEAIKDVRATEEERTLAGGISGVRYISIATGCWCIK